jgi:hypothetical protein
MIHPTAKASREPIAAAFSSQYDKRGGGPRVRIHPSPAESPRTIGPSAAERNRGFESRPLQQRVECEPDSFNLAIRSCSAVLQLQIRGRAAYGGGRARTAHPPALRRAVLKLLHTNRRIRHVAIVEACRAIGSRTRKDRLPVGDHPGFGAWLRPTSAVSI